jgi:hypothetical protein
VLARVGAAHVPVRIEPRASLRPIVEGVPIEEQMCVEHAEENALALATVRDWTSNERPALAVTVHPAYATGLTMHLLRADEGACVVCVAHDADRAVGWLAAACGVPLLAMQPPDSHMQDYRYEWCGVKSLVESLMRSRIRSRRSNCRRSDSSAVFRVWAAQMVNWFRSVLRSSSSMWMSSRRW